MPALHDIVTKDSTDRSVVVHIMDSTDGTPETGVVFNSAGIDLWYRREGAARVAITEATLAALTTAHADGGFLHVSDGDYRLDLPDAAFATGANYVDFGGTVTGMVVVGGRVRLIDASLEVANIAANMTQISGDSTAADNLEVAYDDTAGPVRWQLISDQGTLQAIGSTSSVTLAATAPAEDDVLNGQTIHFATATTGAKQSTFVSDYNGTTKVATLSPALTVALTGATTYKIGATAAGTSPVSANVTQWSGSAVATPTVAGVPEVDVTHWVGTAAATPTVAGVPEVDVTHAAGSAQASIATQASVDTIDNFLDTEVAAILTLLDDPRTEPGQGAPPVNPDLATKIDWLYKAWRNRSTQTSTQYTLYADDATTVDQKATCSSDGTTLVRGEIATGP